MQTMETSPLFVAITGGYWMANRAGGGVNTMRKEITKEAQAAEARLWQELKKAMNEQPGRFCQK
jgi:hypothetical protein